MRELFQTETSASLHCRREAERSPDAAYAPPFREIAAHADRALAALPDIARAEGLPVSPGGSVVGATFSQLRDKLADKLLAAESSYRGTMLGIRHGVDLMRLVRAVAERSGRDKLANFCRDWQQARNPLVERAEIGGLWFAEHPDQAVERARSLLGIPLRSQRA